VVGGHIRTDKLHVQPGANTSSVTFAGPRRQRLLRGGGNVWQHLRSFRKRLFDAIPDDQLRMEGPVGAGGSARTAAASPDNVHGQVVTAGNSSGGGNVSKLTATLSSHDRVPKKQQQQQQGPGSVGYYYELANDWAFTVPMAELATSPAVLASPIYLYEPFWQRQDFNARENVIGELLP
jgi:hypothetical protein